MTGTGRRSGVVQDEAADVVTDPARDPFEADVRTRRRVLGVGHEQLADTRCLDLAMERLRHAGAGQPGAASLVPRFLVPRVDVESPTHDPVHRHSSSARRSTSRSCNGPNNAGGAATTIAGPGGVPRSPPSCTPASVATSPPAAKS